MVQTINTFNDPLITYFRVLPENSYIDALNQGINEKSACLALALLYCRHRVVKLNLGLRKRACKGIRCITILQDVVQTPKLYMEI